MFVFSNFLAASAYILNIIFTVVYWLILIRALISWVNPDPNNMIVQLLYKTTEPILSPIRKILPITYRTGLDFSPIVAFLIILFLKQFLVTSLMDLAYNLR